MIPTRKITAAAAGGALATLVAFVAGLFGLNLPGGAEGAIATLAAFALGWLTGEHDDPGEHAAE
jgi:hypothetical protein